MRQPKLFAETETAMTIQTTSTSIAHLSSEPTPREPSRVVERYGRSAMSGWSPVPDVLLFNQGKLGLTSEDLNVLLNLMAHYYTRDQMPFIRPNVIAKRMGVSTRSVQRSIARLRKLNLIKKAIGEKRQIVHDLSPLLTKLQPLAEARLADRETRKIVVTQRSLIGQSIR